MSSSITAASIAAPLTIYLRLDVHKESITADWARVETLVLEDWSPEQVAGRQGILSISHETIYRYLWADKHAGGQLYRHLRGARKQKLRRYGAYDSRGRLAGKRPIRRGLLAPRDAHASGTGKVIRCSARARPAPES